jgi:hypothetical protein
MLRKVLMSVKIFGFRRVTGRSPSDLLNTMNIPRPRFGCWRDHMGSFPGMLFL